MDEKNVGKRGPVRGKLRKSARASRRQFERAVGVLREAALSSWSFIRRYYRRIGLIWTILVGVCTIAGVVFRCVDNKTLNELTRAIFDSKRPVLIMHPISAVHDIRPQTLSVNTATGKVIDSSRYSYLVFTVENVGTTSAWLDTIYYCSPTSLDSIIDTMGFLLTPQSPLTLSAPIALDRLDTNDFKIRFLYRSDSGVNAKEDIPFEKCFRAAVENGKWRIGVLTATQWNEAASR